MAAWLEGDCTVCMGGRYMVKSRLCSYGEIVSSGADGGDGIWSEGDFIISKR